MRFQKWLHRVCHGYIHADYLTSVGIIHPCLPATRNRTRDHLMAANVYSQMLCQLSYSRYECAGGESLLRNGLHWAHGVVVSHPLSMREAPGPNPNVSMLTPRGALASKLNLTRCFGPPGLPAQEFANTHRRARAHDHKVKGPALCRLS